MKLQSKFIEGNFPICFLGRHTHTHTLILCEHFVVVRCVCLKCMVWIEWSKIQLIAFVNVMVIKIMIIISRTNYGRLGDDWFGIFDWKKIQMNFVRFLFAANYTIAHISFSFSVFYVRIRYGFAWFALLGSILKCSHNCRRTTTSHEICFSTSQ